MRESAIEKTPPRKNFKFFSSSSLPKKGFDLFLFSDGTIRCEEVLCGRSIIAALLSQRGFLHCSAVLRCETSARLIFIPETNCDTTKLFRAEI